MTPAHAQQDRFTLRGLVYTPTFIVCAAFAVRMLALFVAWHRGIPAAPYGYEAGRVAASLASGLGFSSPLPSVQTGATAWLCPLFPCAMAAIFRICGIFTLRSLVAIQIFNCVFASLTVLPIHAIARRSFGIGTAVLSSWLWVFLPSAIHTPLADIWDTALTAFLFAVIFWATLAIGEQSSPLNWALYGALWAVGALTNPAILSVFPFFMAWLLWRKPKPTARSLPLVAIAVCVFAVLLMPWTVRNRRALGTWIPLRSNFGVELWLGNNPAGGEASSFALHPFQNASEAYRFKTLGEIAYVREKRYEATTFMRAHPATTLKFMGRGIVIFWLAVTDRPLADWHAAPLYLKALFIPNLLMILFSWWGAVKSVLTRRPAALLFSIVLLIFPLPYYLTHALVRYRFPIDPIITVLGVYGLTCALLGTRRDNPFPRTA